MKYFITAPSRTDLYWRPGRKGYTTELADAGLYEEEEAKRIESGGRGDRIIPLDTDKKEEISKLHSKYCQYLDNLEEFLTQ
jgi:hypothetical protein